MEHKKIRDLGFKVDNQRTYFKFMFNRSEVTYWKKKKWFSGKSVTDGRGIENLIEQIKSNGKEATPYVDNKESYNHLIGIFQKHTNYKMTDKEKELVIDNMKKRFIVKLSKA